MSRVSTRLAGMVVVALLASAGAACGGDDEPEPAFTAAQVERLIADSIEPTLATNLGAGSTIEVACGPAEDDADYRCDAALFPGGDRSQAMHVIYRVDCDARCTWTPIG